MVRKIKAILLAVSIVGSVSAIASPVCSKSFGLMECGQGTVATVILQEWLIWMVQQ